MNQVMCVTMFGRTLIVYSKPGAKYEFRVYEEKTKYMIYHIGSFESFQEAWKCVEEELWCGEHS